MKQESLFDAAQRDAFWRELKAGGKQDCPCCRRHAQIYRRTLHFTTAWQLIRLYRLNGYGEYVNASRLIMEGQQGVGDFSKAKYWELIERRDMTNADDGKKSSGWWRLTGKGMCFVLGKITIPKVALIFDDKLIGFEGEQVDIQFSLNQRFDYERLMAV